MLGLLIAGAPALGQPAALNQPVPAKKETVSIPGNTVSCVYDYMSEEDREMSLLLIAREISNGGGFRMTSENVLSVNRLIEEAHQKCLARFNWSIGRSDAASGYALTAILGEALHQALDSFGYPATAASDFFSANRSSLLARRSLSRADRVQLDAYLKAHGWEEARDAELALGALYIETLMMKDVATRRFAASGGTTRQPIRRAPARSAKAAPGKP